MPICGIVAEYNPFHSGHSWHIAETRRLLGQDTAVVCAMSGNFTQRGDFAVFEKHARAAAAVACGADLVLELPIHWALSSAERFAEGAAAVLGAAGCTHLSFGSETGETESLSVIADILMTGEAEVLLREGLEKGLSYAAARYSAAKKLLGEQASPLRTPNNMLGIAYLMALRRQGLHMQPVTVPRLGAGHDSISPGVTASASVLRGMLLSGEDVGAFVPEQAGNLFAAEIASGRGPVCAEQSESAVLAALRRMDKAEFTCACWGIDGLADRLIKALGEPTLNAVIQTTLTKRYTASRIRRAILRTYLRIDDMPGLPPYLRVLAMNDRGASVLKAANALPKITKPASYRKLTPDARRVFETESRATDLYTLAYPNPTCRHGGTEFTLSPVKV